MGLLSRLTGRTDARRVTAFYPVGLGSTRYGGSGYAYGVGNLSWGDAWDFAGTAYRSGGLTYACVREIATSVADAPIRVVNANGNDVMDSDPVARIMAMPNDAQSGPEMVDRIICDLEVYGNAYVQKLRRSEGMGMVEGLWPLRPSCVTVELGYDGGISHYAYTPGSEGRGGGQTRNIPPEDVIHIKYASPHSDVYGLSPVFVAAPWLAIEGGLTSWLKDFFDNAARASGAIVAKDLTVAEDLEEIRFRWDLMFGPGTAPAPKDWSEEQAQAVRDQMRGNRHGTAAFQGDIDFLKLSASPDEVNAPEIMAEAQTRACMVHGVAPILVGAKVGLDRSTFANYKEARLALWEEKLTPLYSFLGGALTRGLMPDFARAPRTISFDLEQVPVLRDAKRERVKADAEIAEKGFARGAITKDEYRQVLAVALAKYGDIMPLGGSEGGAFAERQGIALQPAATVSGLSTTGNLTDALADTSQSEFAQKLAEIADRAERTLKGHVVKAVEAAQDELDEDALADAFEGGDPEQIAGSETVVAGLDAMDAALLAAYASRLSTVYEEAIAHARSEWDADGDGDVDPEELAEAQALAFTAAFRVATVAAIVAFAERAMNSDTTARKAARQLIGEVIGLNPQGESALAKMRDDGVSGSRRAKAHAGRVRARGSLAARTEAVAAANEGVLEAAREIQNADPSIVFDKVWSTNEDARVCPICEPLDGVRAALDGTFPGGHSRPPAHPRCRCGLDLVERGDDG